MVIDGVNYPLTDEVNEPVNKGVHLYRESFEVTQPTSRYDSFMLGRCHARWELSLPIPMFLVAAYYRIRTFFWSRRWCGL